MSCLVSCLVLEYNNIDRRRLSQRCLAQGLLLTMNNVFHSPPERTSLQYQNTIGEYKVFHNEQSAQRSGEERSREIKCLGDTSHHPIWHCFLLSLLATSSAPRSRLTFPHLQFSLQQTHSPQTKQHSLASMGCTPSKPSRPRSREAETRFQPYTGPKEFRGSVMPERRPHFQAAQMYEVDQEQEQQRPDRRAAQMYQTYQKLDQERGARESRRYSWEGHPSEKVFTTFEQMAERGIIPKNALKKK